MKRLGLREEAKRKRRWSLREKAEGRGRGLGEAGAGGGVRVRRVAWGSVRSPWWGILKSDVEFAAAS